MKSNIKKAIIATTAITCTAAISYLSISEYILKKIFKKSNKSKFMDSKFEFDEETKSRKLLEKQSILDWYTNSSSYDTWIKSYDGLNLHGKRIINNPFSNKWIILVHGYEADLSSLLNEAMNFSNNNFNCLLIDNRSFGDSEGDYTTLGWHEQFDLLKWIDDLIQDYPEASITLYGLSMGATTVMLTCGNVLPVNVKCAIEDCGFNNLSDMLTYLLKVQTKFDGRIFMPYLKRLIKNRLCFDVDQHDCNIALNNTIIPMLFIHGSSDQLVPYENVFNNYYACKSEKELFTCENFDHAMCHENSEYYSRILKFINRFQ